MQNPYSTLAHPRVRILAWQPGRVQDSKCITVTIEVDGKRIIKGIYVWEGRAKEPMFSWPENVKIEDADLNEQASVALKAAYYRHVDTASLLLRE